MLLDHCNMPVALRRRNLIRNRCYARWNDDFSVGIVVGNSIADDFAIIRQAEVQFREEQLPELTARLSVLQQQVDETERALDGFEFDDEERRIMKGLVETVEVEVSRINDRLYNIRYDINQINGALSHKDKFDLKEVELAFKKTGVHFPGQLKRSYEDLVSFNR
jgi:uncharacterized protein YydD (DUF2326 family)